MEICIMIDSRLRKLAQILVNYSLEVKPNEWVLLDTHPVAMPLAREVYQVILEAGAHVTPSLYDDRFEEDFYKYGSDDQLEWISPIRQLAIEKADALIKLRAADNTRYLTNINPERQKVRQIAMKDILETYTKRAAVGDLRWVLTQYPCSAFAQEADMSLREYEDFIFSATFADQSNPVQCWRDVHDKQQHWVDWLAGKKNVVVRGPCVDLSLSIDGRTFINSDGKSNMPSGEIFTGPVESSANGWIKFSYPAIRSGREVEGVEFEFKEGKVVNARANKNEEFLISQLNLDSGSRYLGEFAIGTNYRIQRFTKSILYDEKIGGTMHLAVGRSYPETGGKNKSSVHWDFICDMQQDSEIWVDDELFYRNGKFQV